MTSSCPDSAQSILASVKFFGSALIVYSLLGPPTVLDGGDGSIIRDGSVGVGVDVTVVGEILSLEFKVAVTIVVLITEESIVFVAVVESLIVFKVAVSDSEGSTVAVVVVPSVSVTVGVAVTDMSVVDGSTIVVGVMLSVVVGVTSSVAVGVTVSVVVGSAKLLAGSVKNGVVDMVVIVTLFCAMTTLTNKKKFSKKYALVKLFISSEPIMLFKNLFDFNFSLIPI